MCRPHTWKETTANEHFSATPCVTHVGHLLRHLEPMKYLISNKNLPLVLQVLRILTWNHYWHSYLPNGDFPNITHLHSNLEFEELLFLLHFFSLRTENLWDSVLMLDEYCLQCTPVSPKAWVTLSTVMYFWRPVVICTAQSCRGSNPRSHIRASHHSIPHSA